MVDDNLNLYWNNEKNKNKKKNNGKHIQNEPTISKWRMVERKKKVVECTEWKFEAKNMVQRNPKP